MSETIDTFHDPRWQSKRMRCPHCERSLPIHSRGECDNCGAHLRVVVETLAPPLGDSSHSQSGAESSEGTNEVNKT